MIELKYTGTTSLRMSRQRWSGVRGHLDGVVVTVIVSTIPTIQLVRRRRAAWERYPGCAYDGAVSVSAAAACAVGRRRAEEAQSDR